MKNIYNMEVNMNVEVLNPEEFSKLFTTWGTFAATCYNTPLKYAERVGKSCLASGHMSGSRSTYINLNITGISRACADQLVRHEQGVVKNMQSQRYVDGEFNYYVDPAIAKNDKMARTYDVFMSNINQMKSVLRDMLEAEGYSGEQLNQVTRGLNPMAIHTELSIGFSIEALIHLCNERLCTCAQQEIRELVMKIRDLAVALVPELETHLVPKCDRLLWCPESKKRCCGRRPVKELFIETK